MLTVLLVIVLLMLVGALPTWPYSHAWGLYPSGGLGLVLIVILLVLLLRWRVASFAPEHGMSRVGHRLVVESKGDKMTTGSIKKRKTRESHNKHTEKRLYKRNEQEPTNPAAPEQRDQKGGADQGVRPTQPPEQGGTGSANPKFDQSKPLADDWGKSDKH
jgi:hypothetical protein